MTRSLFATLGLALALTVTSSGARAAGPFAGTWRAFVAANGMQCRFDLVMTGDGQYLENAHCGPYATSQRGTYRVFANGTLSRAVTAWSPAQHIVVDAGGGSHFEPSARPPGGSYRYTFTNANTMVWRDLIMGGTVTFKRVS